MDKQCHSPAYIMLVRGNFFKILKSGILGLLIFTQNSSQASTDYSANLPYKITYIIEIKQGSELSNKISDYQNMSFYTAQGDWVSFKAWYKPKWTDTSITWLTQLTPNWGVVWGASTGEKAEKYIISPGLKLGLIFQNQINKNSYLSIKATTVLGGRLKEKSCIADYWEIGGMQQVNCRLAASTLQPSETLKYLINEKPYDKYKININYKWLF